LDPWIRVEKVTRIAGHAMHVPCIYCGECASFPSLTVLLMFSALFHWNPFCVPCGPTVWKVEWIMLVESGKWDVACGMWNVACDIRHVACGKWSVEGGMSNVE
jgi:hypothetical protein